ncbi:hypothetical protein ScPMuIL_001950 [Solemya velum]
MSLDKNQVRSQFEKFWQHHSYDTTIQGMMLDTKADILAREEQPEIMSYLPEWEKKDVLELGAGIGRFTGLFAQKAHHVVAVDFMESFTKRNREINSIYRNVEFICSDVMHLDFPGDVFDLIFSNWLLQYLANNEIQTILEDMLRWMRVGGYLFCRESCWYQAGDKKKGDDPTHYRNPKEYEDLFCSANVLTEDGLGVYVFEVVMNKKVETYAKLKNMGNQPIWLLKKVMHTTDSQHVT